MLPWRGATLLVVQLDVGMGGQSLDRVHESEVVDPLHERDHVAVLTAAEAVEDTFGRRDAERRGLLIVERAQALEVAATGIAQLQVLADDLRD